MNVLADWKKFMLIIFNLIQNSIKCNIIKGDIAIVISFDNLKNQDVNKKIKQMQQQRDDHHIHINKDFNSIMSMEIIDTGCGIEANRQKYLFKPFSELRDKQNFQKVKNQNIGLGLSCSCMIIQELGGSLRLLES